MKKFQKGLSAAVLLLLLCLAGCGVRETKQEGDRLQVVTTVFPYYDFTRQIAGEEVELTMVVPAGMDSHSFEPTPADMRLIQNADVLICDTAGRLHNKKNLMEELRKIYRILEKEYPEAYLETLVVLDGTTGQNALVQARQFAEVANVTGIILTKLDGTAKGGIAVAIQSELDIPVKYIGVGESIHDLQKFDADQFVNALFHTSEENA